MTNPIRIFMGHSRRGKREADEVTGAIACQRYPLVNGDEREHVSLSNRRKLAGGKFADMIGGGDALLHCQ
jgi:hypothetical protein